MLLLKFNRVHHWSYEDAKTKQNEQVYIYYELGKYEGPVTFVRLTKAGHCLVLSDQKLNCRLWPTTYINHKQGKQFRSTIATIYLAQKQEEIDW